MTDALIAELERATEGSRELDARIHLTRRKFLIGLGFTFAAPLIPAAESDGYVVDGEHASEAPRYTTSIDAARVLTKNSDWVLLHASEIGADGFALVVYGNPGTRTEVSGIHSRLEIAWCIAALKTRKEPE